MLCTIESSLVLTPSTLELRANSLILHCVLRDNRIELRKYMDKQNQGETSIQAKEKAPEKTTGGGLKLKPRLKLPRVSIDELYSPGFEDYALGRKPFLLIGAMDDWTMVSADNGTWSLDFFKREFGHYHADFYPHNMK